MRGTELTALQRRDLLDLVREISGSAAGWSARGAHGRGGAAHGGDHFCWIGGFSEESPFYYRVQSPVTFIEFDHHAGVFLTNAGAGEINVHTIVRTPNGNDYGFDLLRQHYKTAPHHRHSHHHGDGDRHHHTARRSQHLPRKSYPAFFHAAAASSTRRAAFAIATSIMRPSTVVEALPCATAWSNASSTRA